MSVSTATTGPDNAHRALVREIELVERRFPDVDPAEIACRVQAEFDELEAGATIHAHLATLAGSAVTRRLIAEGHRTMPR